MVETILENIDENMKKKTNFVIETSACKTLEKCLFPNFKIYKFRKKVLDLYDTSHSRIVLLKNCLPT